MMTVGPPKARSRFTIGRIMIGIAVVAILLWMARYDPRILILLSGCLLIGVGPWIVSRPSYSGASRGPKRRRSQRFQFSIWQIMLVSVFAAACSIVARIDPGTGALAFVVFGAAGFLVIHIARGRSDFD
jgi:uncharacterized membrane protein HdeD (DUF308 family)